MQKKMEYKSKLKERKRASEVARGARSCLIKPIASPFTITVLVALQLTNTQVH